MIFPVWKYHLWLNRVSDIKPMSSMSYLGGYNMDVYKNYSPTFIGYFIDDKLVGVNSYHYTNDQILRSRGLFVFPEFRGKGLGVKILQYTIHESRKQDDLFIWSLARKEAVTTYLSAGFQIVSDEIKTETGNNFYVKHNFLQYEN